MSTGIEWTDETWNPVTGCTKVSPGCDHCYAETMHERFHGKGSFADVKLHEDRLAKPVRWRKPSKVFVNSMSDLFHQDVPDEFIARVFAVMAWTPQHTYQILTKRHARMRSLLSSEEFQASVRWFHDIREDMPTTRYPPGDLDVAAPGDPTLPLRNVWLGVSVESQQWADIRVPALLETPAVVRFLSCEPLLGPVDLLATYRRVAGAEGDGPPLGDVLHWVIVGGESGTRVRPMHPQWAREIRDLCVKANIPFLFKQWGSWSPMPPLNKDGRLNFKDGHTLADDGTLYAPGDLAYPDGPRYGEALRAGHDRAYLTSAYRVSKKAAGRELDGRLWDEFPKAVRG